MYKHLEFKIPYPGLKKTLEYLIEQSIYSIKYSVDRWGENNDLRDIWQIGKSNLIYQHDAPQIEQIQSVYTLFEDNIHNIPGAGDCDCFVVFTIAMLLGSNFDTKDIYIILQGNKSDAPSHILTNVRVNNSFVFIDFTQPHYNTIRNYKYYQLVNIEKLM